MITLFDGTPLRTHTKGACRGADCPVHRPSNHPLKNAPIAYLRVVNCLFRICQHRIIHPDPDSLAVVPQDRYDGWHPCCPDRCCLP